ncbi:hypothetical protein PoB_002933700 [Plakobranchus ocellatus]|uniref:Uncharacterized protein n=1 Tax=Plakobranchus ocellatus TaxID=259542 RepID=A0AAV4A7K3_9GAST|nr:hypothetical protein PoB_002933700 [Plakobranchus ocellatus]
MASARVFFSKKRRGHRNGFIAEEVPVVENGYDVQESDEDEVFVQDPHLEISASKPLMHPRSKGGHKTSVKTRTIECRLCTLCKPIFYFVSLVTVLCAVMASIVYVANKHGHQHPGAAILHPGGSAGSGDGKLGNKGADSETSQTPVIGCDQIKVEDVWVVGFPKLLTESAFRLVDVTGDGVLDVILGFATGMYT